MTNSKENLNIQCKYFVQKKNRLCRMTVKPGNDYCGEHMPTPDPSETETDARMPCPLDPTHTCFKSKLQKHLAICNARSQPKPSYYQHNINAVADAGPPRSALSAIPQSVLDIVINKINALYTNLFPTKISTRVSKGIHPAVQEEFDLPGRTETSSRHLRQVSSLLWMLEEEGLLHEHYCYVELGAGKGRLSWLVGAASGGRVLCVERAARRHKREARLGQRAVRVREDLAHLALELLPHAPLVGLAKHLCGDATDLAIRCMTRSEVCSLTRGLLLATCCHHRCLPRSYVGATYLKEMGISEADLNIIFGVVSWATCGIRKASELDTRQERAEIGRRAKLLLDYGRVLHLREVGFDAQLVHFVDATVTLENVCIVAKKRS